jgi:hypothetical protein
LVEIATDTESMVHSVSVKNGHPMDPPMGVSWDDTPEDLINKLGQPSTFAAGAFCLWDQPDGTRISVVYTLQGNDPNVDYLPPGISHFTVDYKPKFALY